MYAYYIICILITIQKNASPPKPSLPLAAAHSPAQLLAFFLKLLPRRALLQLPALKHRSFYDRLFTPVVTLWYLLFQRLQADHTLDAALSDARSGGADRIHKNLSRRLRSNSTCSYSDARQRLPWQFLLQALAVQARQLIELSPATQWHGRILALLDGSTVRLRPLGNITRQFPPHRNQHGRPYWCLMRVTVCFCALTGAALDCALGAVGLGEQVLACQIILRSLARSLFIGDRNFGVFRVVQAARHAGQEVLLRMTDRRARKLLGSELVAGDHPVRWKPTRHDQLEPSCSTQPQTGRLLIAWIQRPGSRPVRLCLFTTLPQAPEFSLQDLVRVYGQRWHIELNLRYLKTQMDLVQLEVKSADMARKEWLAGLLAYNLIRGAQLCAGLHKDTSPLTLSFAAVRRRLEAWLCRPTQTKGLALKQWAELLECLSCCTLPHRRKPRPSEPHAQRHLRQPYPPLIGTRAAARRRIKKYKTKS